ncbi:MAG: DUF2188 domain-containing protein [Gemmatimonadaceae bacterium]
MAQNDLTVSHRTVAWWAVTPSGELRALSVHRTQGEAIRAGRLELLGGGGGELTIEDVNGKIRARDTVGRKGSTSSEGERKSA